MKRINATDEEFIETWGRLGSPGLVSKHFKLSLRSVHSRRSSIQARYGIELITHNDQSARNTAHKVDHKGRVELDIEDGIVIVFSDAHYYEGLVSTAHAALVKFVKHMKPQAVICNGDAFDGGAISRFPRIGWDNKQTVNQELRAVEDRLGDIEAATKGAHLIWTLGNHDARYETFLAARVPEFQGVKGFTLKEHFPRWMPCWSCWVNPNGEDNGTPTVIKHRWKGGVHATHNNTTGAGVNIVTGHLHSLKVTPFSDYRGIRYGVDTGTLADPHGPQFLDYTEDNPKNHRSGFAVLTFKNGHLLWPEVVYVSDEENGIVEFRGARIVVKDM